MPYRGVPEAEQKRALKFLRQELWNNPSWLMPKELVHLFSDQGVLQRVSSIQNRVLNRLLSTSRLNEMNSVKETLPGLAMDASLGVDGLFDQLGDDLMSLSATHALNRNLQINWILQLKELSQDKKLSPSVTSLVTQAMEQTRAKAKSKRNKGDKIHQAHFQYAFELLKRDD